MTYKEHWSSSKKQGFYKEPTNKECPMAFEPAVSFAGGFVLITPSLFTA